MLLPRYYQGTTKVLRRGQGVGQYMSRKLETAEWGDSVVDELARYLAHRQPELKGFTRASLFRMRQFYGIYRRDKKVAPLVRQLP